MLNKYRRKYRQKVSHMRVNISNQLSENPAGLTHPVWASFWNNFPACVRNLYYGRAHMVQYQQQIRRALYFK